MACLVHDFLGDDDDLVRCERGLLLHAEQAPHVCITEPIGTLHVDDRDIGIQRGNGREALAREGARDVPNARVHPRQITALVVAQRVERQPCRAGSKPRHHAVVRVLLDLERVRDSPLDGRLKA